MNSVTEFNRLLESFPFLSLIRSGGIEYVGIIQNVDTSIASVYLYGKLPTVDHKKEFLELGNEWWWETNHQLPIDIVLGSRFQKFYFCLSVFSTRDFEVLAGPEVSIKKLTAGKSRKRCVQLVKKIR